MTHVLKIRVTVCWFTLLLITLREVILPLYSVLVRPPPGVLRPALEPPAQQGHGPVVEGPEECHKNVQRAWAPVLWGKTETGALFTRACSDRTRGNGFKLKEGRLRLDTSKKFFTMRVVKQWTRLHREVVEAPCLERFKARMDVGLSNLI